MQRGFKAKAEALSEKYREDLCVGLYARLEGSLLAERLDANVIYPKQIPGIDSSVLTQLLHKDARAWSAVTIATPEFTTVIVNSAHSPKRQESSLMHELAHLICEHDPGSFVSVNGLMLRTFDPKQEEEASWLGGCLQLPRKGLLWAVKQGMSPYQTSDYFGASLDMVAYRRRVTGINLQLTRYSKRVGSS